MKEMRGLKESAKERSLAAGTSGGARLGRAYNDGYPYPTRAQWVGLSQVAAKNGEPSLVAGGKRTAASLQRREWVAWLHGKGYVLTATGHVALNSGNLRFLPK